MEFKKVYKKLLKELYIIQLQNNQYINEINGTLTTDQRNMGNGSVDKLEERQIKVI